MAFGNPRGDCMARRPFAPFAHGVIAATTLVAGGTAGVAAAQSPDACASLRSFELPSAALEITSAQHVAAGPAPQTGPPGQPGFAANLPAHCRVDGMLERRTGVNGVEYAIRFA